MNFLRILQRTNFRLFQPAQRHFSAITAINNAKDLINKDATQLDLQQRTPTENSGPPREDGLITSLKSACDTVEVFEFVKNQKNLSPEQVMQTMRTMFNLQKSGNSNLHDNQILRHPEFENLCHCLRSKAKFLELNDLIDALKILNFVGVSSKSEIVTILLTYIKNQINELNLGHIVFLEFLLRKYDATPLTDALRLALPMLFQIQVQYQMDHENLAQLSELLIFISRYKVNDQCQTSVVTALTMHGRKIPANIAASIIWSLTDIRKWQPMFEKLLLNCYKALIVSMQANTVSFGTVERTLSRIVDKYMLRYSSFYNEELLDAVCHFTVAKDVGFTKTIYVLKKLNRLSFVSLPLLDYLATEVQKNPAHLTLAPAGVIFTFTGAFCIANYKPPETWTACQEPLLENALLKSDRNEFPWIRLGLDLLVLDIVDHQLLRRIFQDGFLDHFLARENNTLDYLQLLSLYQAVKVLVPNFEGPFPNEQFLQNADRLQRKYYETQPLSDALEILFGADAVFSGLTSRYLHFIDHAVVFDTRTGEVVRRGETAQDVGNLATAPHQKTIAILCMPPSHYAHNVHRLKGLFQLKQRTLQVMDIPTLVVSQQLWHQMPDHEQLPFLEREVRSLL